MKTGNRPQLTTRVVRPGCRVLKLDRSKAEGKVRFPFIRRKKAKDLAERKTTYQHLTRVGKVSMVQVGEDEFRTPNRAERRRAGIRRRQVHVLAAIAHKKGIAALKVPIARVGPINRDCDKRRNAREDRLYGAGA